MAYFIFMTLVRKAPVILVALIGIVNAIVRGKRHPGVSIITFLALTIYFLCLIFFTVLFYKLPDIVRGLRLTAVQISWTYTATYIFQDIGFVFILILLVVAAFRGRAGSNNIYKGIPSNEFT